ncbi:hypothetical protein THIOM_005729 [Candidatus Thiomargarita nelsonii]|uniref:Uncharacterized protein n=1 Tax=Candidatus Thiomargarita nelsonii TaxID=1003181 RepID=A0A176RSG9_9GAMM|nr:hypothetical protein THIOM_005729 [Candidatus Thiomargarita nelsonii]
MVPLPTKGSKTLDEFSPYIVRSDSTNCGENCPRQAKRFALVLSSIFRISWAIGVEKFMFLLLDRFCRFVFVPTRSKGMHAATLRLDVCIISI